MKIRWSHAAAAASIVGLVVWLVLGRPDGSRLEDPPSSEEASRALPPGAESAAGERTLGSEVPCVVPLAWRLARVDPAFGYDEDEVRAVVSEAAALWARGVGRSLFENDPADGFPIRLVYGERQAESRRRRRLGEGIETSRRRLEERRTEIDSSRERHEQLRSRLRERVREFEQRVSSHNMTVRSWNQRDEIPAAVAREIQAAEQALEEERRELARRREELDEARERLRARQERFERRVSEHEQRAEALADAFPPTPVQSGLYREAVRTEDGRAISAEREIRVYRFHDADDLRRVIAHELGHALGVDHTSAPGALMNAEYGRREPAEDDPVIREADLELLRARCPSLGESSGPSEEADAPRGR